MRVRQDDAVAGHGRSELRRARAGRVGRTDAQRQIPRPRHRIGDRCVAIQRRRQGRTDDRRAVHGCGSLHVALGRTLHGHGHSVDDGIDGRGAGPRVPVQRCAAGCRFAALRARPSRRPPQRRADSSGRAHLADPHAPGFRKCHPRQRRAGRIDQRGDSLARDRRPRWRAGIAQGLGLSGAQCAHARRSETVRAFPDGGLPLRRRPARRHADARRERPAQSRCAHRQRANRLGELPRGADVEHRGHSPVRSSGHGKRRYVQLYIRHVQQADKGADLDFLRGCRGHAVPRESH